MGIFFNVFLPNLFTAASGLPLSDFALLYFSREPEELSIPLPEDTSDLFPVEHLLIVLAKALSHQLGSVLFDCWDRCINLAVVSTLKISKVSTCKSQAEWERIVIL